MGRVTFMIGNGFDLNSGLKSRYTDSYDGYFRQNSATKIIAKFKSIIEDDVPTWANFELSMSEYAKEFDNEDDFVECVLDYAVYLRDYLKSEENAFLSQIESDAAISSLVKNELWDSLMSFYKGLVTPNGRRRVEESFDLREERVIYNFICYNYTKVLDVIVESVLGQMDPMIRYSLGRIIHIHGQLESDIVLGLDNEEQLNVHYPITAKGRRAFIKPIFNEEYDDSREIDAKMVIATSDVVCVYGLELGESDLMWRNEIKEWILKDKKHQLVFYKYDYSKGEYLLPQAQMNDEERYREEIITFLFGDVINQYDKYEIQEQVHVPVGCNIFNIADAVQKGLEIAQQKDELRERIKK